MTAPVKDAFDACSTTTYADFINGNACDERVAGGVTVLASTTFDGTADPHGKYSVLDKALAGFPSLEDPGNELGTPTQNTPQQSLTT